MNSVPRAATYEDLLDLPEQFTGEILAGELHTQPRPNSRHANVETSLAAEIRLPFGAGRGGPGGWVVLVEPELHLGPHVMVPDLAAWRRQRLPAVPDGHIDVVPDWVCEILSPATAVKDRKIKLPLYGSLGVSHAWIVDPSARTVEVLRQTQGQWALVGAWGDQDAMRAEPFDAVAIELKLLWDW
jgi:Uma2 family endonuclease